MPQSIEALEAYSPTAKLQEKEKLKRQMSREEKIYDGLELLSQRVQVLLSLHRLVPLTPQTSSQTSPSHSVPKCTLVPQLLSAVRSQSTDPHHLVSAVSRSSSCNNGR